MSTLNSVADPDPEYGAFLTPGSEMEKFGSGMEKIRIRDKHPGYATLVSR
jgi:hypothetical protein